MSMKLPEISRTQQQTVEELLVRLLDPIRTWRAESAKPSRGLRWKKKQALKAAAGEGKLDGKGKEPPPCPTSPPEILSHLTIGFNSTMRRLEMVCQASASAKPITSEDPSTTANDPCGDQGPEALEEKSQAKLAVVFVCRSTVPAPLVESMSFAVQNISRLEKHDNHVQLIYLSKNAEERLSTAANLPKLGVIGVEDCSLAQVLVDYVRDLER
ncbi:hypothetical protein FQN57_005024 [Myotisia sp. PD_48]|nr:hypothetical protein FQN57_005024 [Myotisia sp. PD_48]